MSSPEPLPVAHGNAAPWRRVKAEWWDDIQPGPGPKWLVEDVIPACGLVLMVGMPGTGKSYLALDLAAHVAAGIQWFGSPVEQGLVVYLAAENAWGQRCRIKALRDHMVWPPGLPLKMLDAEFDLTNPADMRRLVAVLQEIRAEREAEIAMIVIDTLSRTFGDRDENSSDMAGYVKAVSRLQALFGSTVLVLHHPAKRGEATPRGHSSLWGACDTWMLVTGTGAGRAPRRVVVMKQRNGEDGKKLSFSLRSVSQFNQCVIEPLSHTSELQSSGGLKGEKELIVEQLRLLSETDGVEPSDFLPKEVRARVGGASIVNVKLWEQASRAAMVPGKRQPDSVRRAFVRAKEDLISKSVVGCWAEWVWLPG